MQAVRNLTQALPVTQTDIRGLCAGTTLLTMDGELPVDHLSVGDRIITRDSGMAVLRGITSRDVVSASVIVKPGSFGHTRPDRTAIVVPNTRVLIRDWRASALFGVKDALVAAQDLIDGEFVSWGPSQSRRIFQLEFDAPHILYADGLEISSL